MTDDLNPNVDDRLDQLADQFESNWTYEIPDFQTYLDQVESEYRERLLRLLLEVDIELSRSATSDIDLERYRYLGHSAVSLARETLDRDKRKSLKGSSADMDPIQIEDYRLIHVLGEGGMGTVWLAKQERPVKRQVALKLIKGVHANDEIIRRFEAERQALAMMEHPNIAKVLDAGTSKSGVPYFVMELVTGTPLTKFCDDHKLSIDERLKLFIPVCKAVQHAHQKGIIHRDIKPSNVLVTMNDGEAIPKVIDFGLAKATEHTLKLTDQTMFTEFGKIVGTIQYMSPEQAETNSADVDTRTDIYSLGVMLYELLIGTTPLNNETLVNNALLQSLEIIREREPQKPSERLSSSTNSAADIGELRRIAPSKLQQILEGELDWVVMKSLEKDRHRRYDTASELAQDIERYLNHEAVIARPPSLAYRFGKFARKNRSLVGSLVAISLTLIAGIVGTGWGLVNANRNAASAMAQKKIADNKTELAKKNESLAVSAKKEADRKSKLVKESESFTKLQLSKARWDTNRVVEARSLLAEIPEEHRSFEWYYYRRHFLGSDFTCYGHTGAVNSVCFSPDGEQLVSGSNDASIKIWDATTGELVNELLGHSDGVNSVCFSPDGSRIASASFDKKVKVWNSKTGQEVLDLQGHTDGVLSICFSDDNSLVVSGSLDNSIKVWNARTGELLRTLNGHRAGVTDVSFEPAGERIASTSGYEFKIWDVKEGREIRSLKHELKSDFGGWLNTNICFCPNSNHIVSSWDKKIKIWDSRTGEELEAFLGHSESIESVSVSPNSRWIATGASDSTVKLWDIKTNSEIHLLKGHSDEVLSVGFSPDGSRIASGSSDMTVKVWDVRSGSADRTLNGHGDSVNAVCFGPKTSTKIASASDDTTVRIWDAISGNQVYELKGHAGAVNCVKFSPDETYVVSGSDDKSVKIWDARTGNEIRTLQGHSEEVASVSVSSDSALIASGSHDETVRIWDAATGELLTEIKDFMDEDWEFSSEPVVVNFNPIGKSLAIGSNANVEQPMAIWDIQSHKQIQTFRGFASGLNYFCFSTDGTRIASGGTSSRLTIWDTKAGSKIRTFDAHRTQDEDFDHVNSLCFSIDGTLVASATDDSVNVKIWNIDKGFETCSLTGHTDSVLGVSFSDDDMKVAGGGADNTIRIWGGEKESERRSLLGHDVAVDFVWLSPNDTQIISCGTDGTKIWDIQTVNVVCNVQGDNYFCCYSDDAKKFASINEKDNTISVWDAKTGSRLVTLTGHSAWVCCVDFSNDGERIVSASSDQTIKIWDSETGAERLTLRGHQGSFGVFGGPPSVFFGADGQRVYSQAVLSSMEGGGIERIVWDCSTGKQLKDAPWIEHVTYEQKQLSSNGHRFVTHEGRNVILVDLEFKNTPNELAYRKAKASLDPTWHRRQALKFEAERDWFGAAFHRAWVMKSAPENAANRELLDADVRKLKVEFAEQDNDAEFYLPSIVEQMLSLALGNNPPLDTKKIK